MLSKIYRFELYFLFTFTLLTLFAVFLSDIFSEHYLVISSQQSDFFALKYYVGSFFSFFDYYLGPWIALPFISSAIWYAFIAGKRENIIDIFLPVLSFIFFLNLSLFIGGSVVGAGFTEILLSYFGLVPRILIFTVSFGLLTALVFAFDFKKLFSIESWKSFVLFRREMKESFSATEETGQKENTKNAESLFRKLLPSPILDNLKNIEIETLETNNESQEVFNNGPEEEQKEEGLVPIPTFRSKKTLGNHIQDGNYYETVSTISVKKHNNRVAVPDESYFLNITNRIEEKLNEFKIDGQIINVLKGPVVDTFELELGSGVKVSKVTSSIQDLSLALYGAPIRIVYPMKGRTTIGIEVPRNPREIIFLDEVLSAVEFSSNHSNLPVAMGKDAFGQTFVVDLASMPHMLVAGSTGAGKSVFINTLLVSLLVKKSPRQMKLILIDPKQLELALYSKLPHLIMPVVTEAKKASLSLLWLVEEMERRYTVLKELAVRNIEGFNEKIKTLNEAQKIKIAHLFEGDISNLELPYVVVIIDEFADLILTKYGKDIENNVCRLAAKARASGIHLVIATQRPSVDVITGLIKSNFPTRVSFRVTTDVDSRTILNATGAEKLLGKGDMLYKYGVETTRVHASYIDEKEIEELTLKLEQFNCDFDENAMEFLENEGDSFRQENESAYFSGGHGDLDDDSLYGEAIKIVVESRLASASMLQRRLKIGYNRAANLIEEMESKGIVGPAQGSKPRKVLVSPVNTTAP